MIGLDCAPLAGVSDGPFRLIAKLIGGPDQVFSEMVSAVGLVRNDRRSRRMFFRDDRERPLVVQLFGADPLIVAQAARIVVEQGADAIDLNLACPVRKVVKTGAGLALMLDEQRAAKLFEMTRQAAQGLPLSVKLRAGWRRSEPRAVLIGRLAEQAGLNRVILHPRFHGGYDQPADWRLIAQLVSELSIPVTGNGDLRSGADALRMVEQTGCDRVMIGRAALGDPWIFRRVRAALDGRPEPAPPTVAQRGAVLLRHMDLALEVGGPEALRSFRKHLGWYARGIQGVAEFRRRAMRLSSVDEVRRLVYEFFPGSSDSAFDRGPR
ncbi:MAG: tRNA-dihydrouridine synthase [Candidatus Alcyoniella australis]|nr:tRNA-dihydrouridine synthase [Candidatus Alcyoniella australis]